jgi:hypothetical protein
MNQNLEGRCSCGEVRYGLTETPLFVHCCHCSWCQRESGTAFATNAMIESQFVALLQGKPELILTPSNSGKGQAIARCRSCKVALWSHYAGAGEIISFVRVGSLEEPASAPPDIHIFTSTKQAWVILPADTPAVEEYYRRSEYWPQASLDRWQIVRSKNTP